MVAGILGSVETLGVLESAAGGQKPFQKKRRKRVSLTKLSIEM